MVIYSKRISGRFEEVRATHIGDRELRRQRKSPNVLEVICRKTLRLIMAIMHR